MNPRSTFFRVMFALVIIWAIYLRFWGTWNRSLWMDEAAVANMLLDTSWAGLFTQTDIPVAPLFAAGAKLTGSLVAPPEVGYRLIPIICGILCVPLVYFVMRAMRMPRAVSLAAMALCASSPWLVIWSRELKQYECEAFTSLLLALAVLRILFGGPQTKRTNWAIGAIAVCLFSPWLGYGFLFAAFALLVAMATIRPEYCCRKFTVITSVAALMAMGLSTALMMRLLSGGQANHEALRSFMQPWFIDITSVRSMARAAVYMASSASMTLFPYYRWLLSLPASALTGAVVWVLILFGLWTWPRSTRSAIIIWIFVAWGSVAIAAMLGRYPFGAVRMLVFTAVPMSCAMAMGAVGLLRLLPIPAIPAHILRKATVIACLVPAIYLFRLPLDNDYWVNQDFKAALESLSEKRSDGERVFVSLDAVQPVRFYAGADSGFDFVPCTNGTRPVPGYDYREFARGRITEYGNRCWLLTIGRSSEESWKAFLDVAAQRGYRAEMVSQTGGDNGTGKAQLFLLTRG